MIVASMNLSAISVIFLALAGLGCSAEKDATARRLDDLQGEISRLKASNIALHDRVEAVESQQTAATTATDVLVDDDRPTLAVVRVSPEAAAAEEPEILAPETDEERPSIVGDRHRVEQAAPRQAGRGGR
jgi:hypothetical protein